MLAKSRTLSEMMRRNCDSTSSTIRKRLQRRRGDRRAPSSRSTPSPPFARMPSTCEMTIVSSVSVERDRDVRGRRVDREARDAADHVLCVSSGSGMNEIMLMIQMNMNSVATYGNQRVNAPARQRRLADVRLRERVDRLDHGLQCASGCCRRPPRTIQSVSDDRDQRRQPEVDDRLRDAQVERADLEVEPRLDDELLDRLELLLVGLRGEGATAGDEQEQEAGAARRDVARRLITRSPGSGPPGARASECEDRAHEQVDGEVDEERDRRRRRPCRGRRTRRTGTARRTRARRGR